MRPPRFSLLQVFALAAAAMLVLGAVLLYALFEVSQNAVMAGAVKVQDQAAERVRNDVEAARDAERRAVRHVEEIVRLGVLDPKDPVAVEQALFSEIIARPELTELTLTGADRTGVDRAGAPVFGADNRWQVSVFREGDEEEGAFITRRIVGQNGGFVELLRKRPPGGAFDSAELAPAGPAPDPTMSFTFLVPAEKQWGTSDSEPTWSDLHFENTSADDRDQHLRVTAMRVVRGKDGSFVGVARAAIHTRWLDRDTRKAEVHLEVPRAFVFICDEQGRLISRIHESDVIAPSDGAEGDLRVMTPPPEPVRQALAGQAVRRVAPGSKEVEHFRAGGEEYIASFVNVFEDPDSEGSTSGGTSASSHRSPSTRGSSGARAARSSSPSWRPSRSCWSPVA